MDKNEKMDWKYVIPIVFVVSVILLAPLVAAFICYMNGYETHASILGLCVIFLLIAMMCLFGY